MLLWKDMYPARPHIGLEGSGGVEEWDRWGRPPNGFIDLGCVSQFSTVLLAEQSILINHRAMVFWFISSYQR